MADAEENRVLALAAVFLALGEVRAIAEQGKYHRDSVQTVLRGIFHDYAGDVARLYGGADALDEGLQQLIDHLSQPTAAQLTRYLVAVLQLERRLRGDRTRLNGLMQGLEQAQRQAEYFDDIQHANVISRVADIYAEHLSTMRPRILVQGHAMYLQDERNAAMIRALLLSAIRAAGLWEAHGGGRLRLVFGRRGIIEKARQLRARS